MEGLYINGEATTSGAIKSTILMHYDATASSTEAHKDIESTSSDVIIQNNSSTEQERVPVSWHLQRRPNKNLMGLKTPSPRSKVADWLPSNAHMCTSPGSSEVGFSPKRQNMLKCIVINDTEETTLKELPTRFEIIDFGCIRQNTPSRSEITSVISTPISPETSRKQELCSYLKLMNMSSNSDKQRCKMLANFNRRSNRVKNKIVQLEKQRRDNKIKLLENSKGFYNFNRRKDHTLVYNGKREESQIESIFSKFSPKSMTVKRVPFDAVMKRFINEEGIDISQHKSRPETFISERNTSNSDQNPTSTTNAEDFRYVTKRRSKIITKKKSEIKNDQDRDKRKSLKNVKGKMMRRRKVENRSLFEMEIAKISRLRALRTRGRVSRINKSPNHKENVPRQNSIKKLTPERIYRNGILKTKQKESTILRRNGVNGALKINLEKGTSIEHAKKVLLHKEKHTEIFDLSVNKQTTTKPLNLGDQSMSETSETSLNSSNSNIKEYHSLIDKYPKQLSSIRTSNKQPDENLERNETKEPTPIFFNLIDQSMLDTSESSFITSSELRHESLSVNKESNEPTTNKSNSNAKRISVTCASSLLLVDHNYAGGERDLATPTQVLNDFRGFSAYDKEISARFADLIENKLNSSCIESIDNTDAAIECDIQANMHDYHVSSNIKELISNIGDTEDSCIQISDSSEESSSCSDSDDSSVSVSSEESTGISDGKIADIFNRLVQEYNEDDVGEHEKTHISRENGILEPHPEVEPMQSCPSSNTWNEESTTSPTSAPRDAVSPRPPPTASPPIYIPYSCAGTPTRTLLRNLSAGGSGALAARARRRRASGDKGRPRPSLDGSTLTFTPNTSGRPPNSSHTSPSCPASAGGPSSSDHCATLAPSCGRLLRAEYAGRHLVAVQERLLTCWAQTPLGHVLHSQLLWINRGAIARQHFADSVHKPLQNSIMIIENVIAYVEIWVKEHKSAFREQPVADVFAVVYIWRVNQPVEKKLLQLENINGHASDVECLLLVSSRSILMTWSVSLPLHSATLIHCYHLSSDYQRVLTVQEVRSIDTRVRSLHCIRESAMGDGDGEGELVLGCGEGRVHVWNVEYGYIVSKLEMGETEGAEVRSLWTYCDRGFLFLLQECSDGLLRLIAINGMKIKMTWKNLKTFNPPKEFDNLLGVCCDNGILVACYENGLLCWNVQSCELLFEEPFASALTEGATAAAVVAPSRFLCGKHLIQVQQDGQIRVKHIVHHLLTTSHL